MMRKLFIAIGLLCVVSLSFSQIKNLGTQAKVKPEPNYILGFYGYYDIVREFGLGLQLQINNKFSIDARAYRVYPNGALTDYISQWDYYDFKGYGFGVNPRYHFGNLKRGIIGLNIAYERLYHNKTWVEYYDGRSFYPYHVYEERAGYLINIGPYLSSRILIRRVFVEPFFSMALALGVMSSVSYDSDAFYGKPPYPDYETNGQNFFYCTIGLKLGFATRKNKRHEAIDRKLDAFYIPQYNALKAKSDTCKMPPKSTLKAKKMVEKANRNFLRRYNNFYSDTTKYYQYIESYLKAINDNLN